MVPSSFIPTFSGHETFVLRSNWLKKGYDVIKQHPDLFSRPDAYVRLGIGKNMAQSIRYWGRVCGVFDKQTEGTASAPTPLGDWLLADDGADPFLVSPASWWLLHWQLAARPEAAITWFYTFNLLRGGEFTISQLGLHLQAFAAEHNWRMPSTATIERDIDCLVRCYTRPSQKQLATAVEDALLCPLMELGLLQNIPGQRIYRLVSGPQPGLPDALLAYAIHAMVEADGRKTISLRQISYAPRSPGRVFRLDEDTLLHRLSTFEKMTQGAAFYTDQAGIRQVSWRETGPEVAQMLLEQAFAQETTP
ncbi:MAG: DUF4007 family protein [Chloroflexaceae bacterium]|nr:DUF4007 family protein [Chloroflexaceae bacterium]